ncbi:MAG: LysM peptidoglycan-binding domain-containing protein [Chloroflexota bacterium]|nr:LysM peptidoglycan-binding domain-containing protein [Chloroflexota bacterium]
MKNKLLWRGVIFCLLVGLLFPQIVSADPDAAVSVDAPSEAAPGSTFIAWVNISWVTNFDACDYEVVFDPSVLELTSVTYGTIDGTTIPIATTNEISPGRVKVVENVLGTPGVTGSGYLARLNFHVIGYAGQSSVINLENGTLSDNAATEIMATWTGATVTVSGPTPTPGPTSTPTPTPTPGPGFYYTVRWGDTLSRIAKRFGTTVDAIASANGLADPNYIRAGQTLFIPGVSPPPSPGTYIVQPGDTLYSIAKRYGTTVAAICQANHIFNPDYIQVGWKLIIPGGEPIPPSRTYIVKPGDTLWAIAIRFGTTPWAIAVANDLADPNLILVGQRLLIP